LLVIVILLTNLYCRTSSKTLERDVIKLTKGCVLDLEAEKIMEELQSMKRKVSGTVLFNISFLSAEYLFVDSRSQEISRSALS
jgi:hypothetical protein